MLLLSMDEEKDWRLPFFPDCEAHTMPAAVVAFTYVLDKKVGALRGEEFVCCLAWALPRAVVVNY